jgi:hypothetical protein
LNWRYLTVINVYIVYFALGVNSVTRGLVVRDLRNVSIWLVPFHRIITIRPWWGQREQLNWAARHYYIAEISSSLSLSLLYIFSLFFPLLKSRGVCCFSILWKIAQSPNLSRWVCELLRVLLHNWLYEVTLSCVYNISFRFCQRISGHWLS